MWFNFYFINKQITGKQPVSKKLIIENNSEHDECFSSDNIVVHTGFNCSEKVM